MQQNMEAVMLGQIINSLFWAMLGIFGMILAWNNFRGGDRGLAPAWLLGGLMCFIGALKWFITAMWPDTGIEKATIFLGNYFVIVLGLASLMVLLREARKMIKK